MDFNTVHLLFYAFSAEFLLSEPTFPQFECRLRKSFLLFCGKVDFSEEKFLENLRKSGKHGKTAIYRILRIFFFV